MSKYLKLLTPYFGIRFAPGLGEQKTNSHYREKFVVNTFDLWRRGMILAHCLKCEFHERVEIDHKLYSKCNNENCLSIYSNCVRVTAVKKFVSENDVNQVKDLSSALEICYPLA